jgi:predicted ATPase
MGKTDKEPVDAKRHKRNKRKHENFDLSIRTIPTKKDKIKQPPLSEADVIPRINSSALFVGASGSGKTTVVANLLTRSDMLAGAFDRTFLISPTAKTDDIQGYLQVPDEDIIDDLKEAPGFLREIQEEQRDEIEAKGADKAKKYLVIFDDVISDRDLMRSDEFIRSFIMNRHFKGSAACRRRTSSSSKEVRRRRSRSWRTALHLTSLEKWA